MHQSSQHTPRAVTRRGFLAGAGIGLAAGLAAGFGPRAWWAFRDRGLPSFTGRTVEDPAPPLAMPGPFPGRVVEVHHPGSVRPDYAINADAVTAMMERGMCELT